MSTLINESARLADRNIVILPPLGSPLTERTDKYNVRSDDNSLVKYRLADVSAPKAATYLGQPKLLIGCDWLTLRCTDSLVHAEFLEGVLAFEGTPYRLELAEHGTPFFKKLAKIFLGDHHIAEVQFDARMQVSAGDMFIKYENSCFYDSAYMDADSGKSAVFGALFAALRTSVLGVTRLDICVDGCDFHGFIHDYQTEKFEKLKLANISCMFSGEFATELDYFTVGKRGGKKFGCYYNKTKEIVDKGHKKQYILDYHQANGFDLNKDTWRFEIRLNGEALKDMRDFQFDETILSHEALLNIFNFQLQNFFEFVPADSSDSRRSRRDKVQMFYFYDTSTVYVRVKRKLVEGTRTAKIMAKRLLRDAYTATGLHSVLKLTTVRELVSEYFLEAWIIKRQDIIQKDILKYANARSIEINPDLLFDVLADLEFNAFNL